MWNLTEKPQLFTIESLKINQQRRSERHHRRSKSPDERRRENIKPNKPNVVFKSGSYLSKHMRLFFSPEMVNVPLRDLDAFYSDSETFVIVTELKVLHRYTAKNTLNIFNPFNPIRRTCISTLHNWIYRWFMILTAFMDCCLLTTPRTDFHPTIYYIFGSIYTFDIVTTLIAKGFIFDQFSILRDGWGAVDFLLLLPYFVPYTGRNHFLCGFRCLKIAALIPSLKVNVEAVVKTVVDLRNMFILTLFTTWIFSIVGHQFYMGVSTQRCIHDFPEDGSVGENRDRKWHAWVSNRLNWFRLNRFHLCGNYSSTWPCPDNHTCLQIQKLDDRLYGSMGVTLLSTIRLVQQDSWETIYRTILITGGPWHLFYFVATLSLGSFYMLNMILAVVANSYDKLSKELNLAVKLECNRNKRTAANISSRNEIKDIDENRSSNLSNERLNIVPKCLDSDCKHHIKKGWTCFVNKVNFLAFDPFTELIMAFATVANLILLSIDHFKVEENESLYSILVSGYQIFSIMFAVETLLKFVASGPTSYFKDKWNMFEFSLVFLSAIKFGFDYNSATMSALLSLRSLRIFKLARIWPTINTLVNGVLSAMGNVSDMTVVALGTFYMFCVAGVHLFGGNDGKGTLHSETLWHFRDFTHSFLVIFRLLCGEWTETMSECMGDHGWICIPFFLSAVIILNLVVLNLLLVMFLQCFSTTNYSKMENEEAIESNNFSAAVNRFKKLGKWMKISIAKCLGINSRERQNSQPVSITQQQTPNSDEETALQKCGCPKFRSKFRTITESKYFKYFSIGITFIAAVCVSLRDVNLRSRPQLNDIVNVAESTTSVFLGVEAAIKIAALGFFPYIKIKWNCLDFIILLGTILNAVASFFGAGSVSFFYSMRVLRLFSNFEGMRILFNALGTAMTKIFGVLIVCLLIWLVFAIIGVQLLKGKLHFCLKTRKSFDIIRNKADCLQLNFAWENSPWNFDNVGSAYYRILEIITFKGWIKVLNLATKSGEIDEQLSFEKSLWISGYFIAVILVGSFFAFNLFIGVLIDSLNEEKGKFENTNENCEKDIHYQKTRKNMLAKLKRKFSHTDTNMWKYRRSMWSVLTSKQFEILIFLNLVFNMVLLTLEQPRASMIQTQTLAILNGMCTTIFASECLFKILALKWQFWRQPRNIYELFVELLSSFELIGTGLYARASLTPFQPGLLRLVRFIWVSEYLRHIKAANGLRKLISVLQISLPAFFNICVLLFLVIFIYATLGMEFFKNREVMKPYLGFNFETLPEAIVILFPIITSAGWDMLMDVLTIKLDCVFTDPQMDTYGICGNAIVAGFFVISYLFITFVILVNMFSAVILENYSRVMTQVECELGDEHFEMFYEIWLQFDKAKTHFIGCAQLPDLFGSFEGIFKVSNPNHCAISLMNIPIYKGNVVHCADVLDAAITYLYFRKGAISPEKFNNYQNELKDEKGWKQGPITTTLQIQCDKHCVKTIQHAWRIYKTLK